jgi:hypothetical protein
MKKLIPLLILLASCSLYQPVGEFNSPEEIMQWVHDNVAPLKDPVSHAQTATETLELRTGDCEDYAILMVAMCWKHLGLKFNIGSYRIVRNDKLVCHAVVMGDKIYDPVYNKLDTVKDWELFSVASFASLLFYGYL